MYMSLSKPRELVMDREAWRAAVHGVAKSRIWLSHRTDWSVLHTCSFSASVHEHVTSMRSWALSVLFTGVLPAQALSRSSVNLYWMKGCIDMLECDLLSNSVVGLEEARLRSQPCGLWAVWSWASSLALRRLVYETEQQHVPYRLTEDLMMSNAQPSPEPGLQ